MKRQSVITMYGEKYMVSNPVAKLLIGSLEDISPLTTLGGKWWARNIYNPIIEYCGREYNLTTYIEGTGGGCKMLANLNTQVFRRRIYNELDYDIYCYFNCLSDRKTTKTVMETIKDLVATFKPEELFNLAYNNRENRDIPKELVAAFAYIRSYGSDKGDRKTFNPKKFNDNLEESKKYLRLSVYNSILQGIETTNTDCFNLIRKYNENSEYFYFGDHPYFKTKTYGENDWKSERYAEFVRLVRNTKMKMIICDEKNPYYDILVKYCNWNKYFMMDRANSRSAVKGKEAKRTLEHIWVNFDIPLDLLPEGAKKIV